MKKYLSEFPEIFAELHPEKNDLEDFSTLTHASRKRSGGFAQQQTMNIKQE